MSIQNKKVCPICGNALQKEIRIDDCDAIHVACDVCGKYAVSREFYEDYIEQENAADTRARLANFLAKHKNDKTHPFMTENAALAPDGYTCFPRFICMQNG